MVKVSILVLFQHLPFELPCYLLLLALVSVNLGGWMGLLHISLTFVDPRNTLKSFFAGDSRFVVKDILGYLVS